MKYIKLFERFDEDGKFEKDIKDMFVELEDDGYKVTIYNRVNYQVDIYKYLRFDLDKVKEYILMFIEYMKERFDYINFSYKVENIYQEEIFLSSYEDLEDVKEEIVSLSILIES